MVYLEESTIDASKLLSSKYLSANATALLTLSSFSSMIE